MTDSNGRKKGVCFKTHKIFKAQLHFKITIWKNFTYNLWSFITFEIRVSIFENCQFKVTIFKFFFNFNHSLESLEILIEFNEKF
jgi:hypothetical protein